MLLSVALSTASRNRGLLDTSPVPSFAATVISRISRLKIAPRFASVAALRCLMFAHLLWPAMVDFGSMATQKLYASKQSVVLNQALLGQKPAQRAQADQCIVDLEHALLDRQ